MGIYNDIENENCFLYLSENSGYLVLTSYHDPEDIMVIINKKDAQKLANELNQLLMEGKLNE